MTRRTFFGMVGGLAAVFGKQKNVRERPGYCVNGSAWRDYDAYKSWQHQIERELWHKITQHDRWGNAEIARTKPFYDDGKGGGNGVTTA